MSRFCLCNCPAGFSADPERHAPDCPGRSGAGKPRISQPVTVKLEPSVAELQATIYRLTAENERLARESERVNRSWHGMKRDLDNAKSEIERLKGGAVYALSAENQRVVPVDPRRIPHPLEAHLNNFDDNSDAGMSASVTSSKLRDQFSKMTADYQELSLENDRLLEVASTAQEELDRLKGGRGEPILWVHPHYLNQPKNGFQLAIDATLTQIVAAQVPLFLQPAPVSVTAMLELAEAAKASLALKDKIKSAGRPPHADFWHQSQCEAEARLKAAYEMVKGPSQ